MTEPFAGPAALCLDPCKDERWLEFVKREGLGLFGSPPWLKAVADAYGFEAEAVVVLDSEGVIRSGFPFAVVHDLRGERRVVYPFSDYCDPVVDDETDWRSMEDAIGTTDFPTTFRALRPQPFETLPEIEETGRSRWHRIHVLENEEDQWSALRGNARQMIRRARKSGVTTSTGSNAERLRAFYEMHCGVRREKYRMLTQPFAFFEQLLAKFGPELQIVLSHYDDRIVGGTLYLEWEDTLYYKFAASRLDDLDVRPNEIAIWEALRLARSRGLAFIDLGISGLNQPGLIRYKEKFAQDSEDVRYLRRVADAGSCLRDTPELQSMTERLCEPGVPEEVYRRAGDLLYRVFC